MPSVTGTSGAGSGLPEPSGFGVLGDSDSGPGVVGTSNSGPSGFFNSKTGEGVQSFTSAPFRAAVGGLSNDQDGTGVYGTANTGVYGSSTTGVGVWGDTEISQAGVHGRCFADWGAGVMGEVTGHGYAVWGLSQNSYAGLFEGNVLMAGSVWIYGSLSKPGGSFRIDHPLDPANKYLAHSFVESPEMLNVYDGVVELDARGEAQVDLPDWFEALNRSFRYQLTPIGGSAPDLHISREIEARSFRIAGGRPGGRVSWQVTGVRQDRWANANRVRVEEDKPPHERGQYLHPQLYGEPEEKKVMPGPRPHAGRAPQIQRTPQRRP